MKGDRGFVLVAEHDVKQRRALVATLRLSGFVAEDVSSGQEAAQALEKRDFDLLLVDAELRGLSGFELLSWVREQELPLSVIVMTEQPTLEAAVIAIRSGVTDYLTKPIEGDLLLGRLDEAMRRVHVQRALGETKRRAAELSRAVEALELAMTTPRGPSHPPPSDEASKGDPFSRLDSSQLARLSPREREVTQYIARGAAVNDTAQALNLSPNTVRNHVKSIFSKLQVHSQVALLSKLTGHSR